MARPEHIEMAAVSKIRPAVKSLKRKFYGMPTQFFGGKGRCCRGRNRYVHSANRRDRGPGIAGKVLRDNVGKSPLAAGAGSNLQGLLK